MPILYSNHACSEIHQICCLIILPSRAQGSMGFPDNSVDKESACNARDLGLIPGFGRAPGEGNGYPLQYSGLQNSMDRGLVGYSLWGCKESDMTKRLSLSASLTTLKPLTVWITTNYRKSFNRWEYQTTLPVF